MSTFAAVVAAEVGIRVLGRLNQSPFDYGDTIEQGLLKPGFAEDVVGGNGGTVRWTNNLAGFRATREFSTAPPPGTLRILSLGDSFTAGYRVGDEETFSRRLEIWLNQRFGPSEVLVNGIEEPDNGLKYLREEGVGWSPHLLLFGITLGNDIAQSYVARHPTRIGFREGLEGLELPPESLREEGLGGYLVRRLYYASLRSRVLALIRPRRAIVSWYGHVYPPRLFDANNGFGVFLANPPGEVETAYERLFQILDDVGRFSDANDIRLVVALFPQRFQVQPEDWSSAVRAYGLRAEAFDLNAPNQRIARYCVAAGVTCVDPTAFMRERRRETGTEYYLPMGDMHWNAAGHALWAEGARAQLEPVVGALFDQVVRGGVE